MSNMILSILQYLGNLFKQEGDALFLEYLLIIAFLSLATLSGLAILELDLIR